MIRKQLSNISYPTAAGTGHEVGAVYIPQVSTNPENVSQSDALTYNAAMIAIALDTLVGIFSRAPVHYVVDPDQT